MPIKPENRDRYPPDWALIRNRIIARAGNRCEQCRVGNGWIGYRDAAGTFHKVAACGRVSDYQDQHATGWKLFRIVLTVAHLDHVPENCEPENLRAWCQRCHLTYDAAHHAQNARATRHNRRAAGDLFPVEK